jgi:hypothetical protein
MTNSLYWTTYGNVPAPDNGVTTFDVNGNGSDSWCFRQVVADGQAGGITQEISVIAGVTYSVSADFCYHNC